MSSHGWQPDHPGVHSPCNLQPWLEPQAWWSPPLPLAALALQPAAPFCSVSSWRTRSSFHTCCLLRLFLLSWQQEHKDLPWFLRSGEAAIFALKVTDLGAARIIPLVEQAPKEQMAQVPRAKRKLSCHLRP